MDDGVADIDHHGVAALTLSTEQRAADGKVDEEPRGDRVGLSDVTEGESAQERVQVDDA